MFRVYAAAHARRGNMMAVARGEKYKSAIAQVHTFRELAGQMT